MKANYASQSRPSAWLVFALAACLPSAARAGDPCPIGFRFVDLGAIPSLDSERAVVGSKGPIADQLFRHANKQECLVASRATIRDGRVLFRGGTPPKDPTWQTVKRIRTRLFTAKRRTFFCSDAHRNLKPLRYADRGYLVFVLRGHRRTIVSVPGWTSVCVHNKGQASRIAKAWRRLSKRPIAHSHANP